MVGSEQVGGHARVMVGDKWRWFGYDRGLGGGLGGGLEGEGGPHLPPVTVEVEGGGGPLPCEVVEGVHEQVDGGLGGHGHGGHLGGFTPHLPSWRNYSGI